MTTKQLLKFANKISIKYSQTYEQSSKKKDFFGAIKSMLDSGEIDREEFNRRWRSSAEEYNPEKIEAEMQADKRLWEKQKKWEEESLPLEIESFESEVPETSSSKSQKKTGYPIKKVEFLACLSNFYNLFKQEKQKLNISDADLSKIATESGKIMSSEITSSVDTGLSSSTRVGSAES